KRAWSQSGTAPTQSGAQQQLIAEKDAAAACPPVMIAKNCGSFPFREAAAFIIQSIKLQIFYRYAPIITLERPEHALRSGYPIGPLLIERIQEGALQPENPRLRGAYYKQIISKMEICVETISCKILK